MFKKSIANAVDHAQVLKSLRERITRDERDLARTTDITSALTTATRSFTANLAAAWTPDPAFTPVTTPATWDADWLTADDARAWR